MCDPCLTRGSRSRPRSASSLLSAVGCGGIKILFWRCVFMLRPRKRQASLIHFLVSMFLFPSVQKRAAAVLVSPPHASQNLQKLLLKERIPTVECFAVLPKTCLFFIKGSEVNARIFSGMRDRAGKIEESALPAFILPNPSHGTAWLPTSLCSVDPGQSLASVPGVAEH